MSGPPSVYYQYMQTTRFLRQRTEDFSKNSPGGPFSAPKTQRGRGLMTAASLFFTESFRTRIRTF